MHNTCTPRVPVGFGANPFPLTPVSSDGGDLENNLAGVGLVFKDCGADGLRVQVYVADVVLVVDERKTFMGLRGVSFLTRCVADSATKRTGDEMRQDHQRQRYAHFDRSSGRAKHEARNARPLYPGPGTCVCRVKG